MPVNSDHLVPGEAAPNQSISSASGRYTFVYQGDGNLVLYKNYPIQPRRPLWASNTGGTPGSCIMEGDGNLVIYDPDGQPVWPSNIDRPDEDARRQVIGFQRARQPRPFGSWLALGRGRACRGEIRVPEPWP